MIDLIARPGAAQQTERTTTPQTLYAESEAVSIAYRDFGNGAQDRVAGSGIGFDGRGSHVLMGMPGEWQRPRAQVD